MARKRRVIIIGGGFAGVDVAKRLHRKLAREWEILLFSKENHFIFTPLLAEVVGSAINPVHVVRPIREMTKGVSCRTAPVVTLDLKAGELVYERPNGLLGHEPYDQLVLAAGLAVNMNIVPGMNTNGWPLKTLGDAMALSNRIVDSLEKAQVALIPEDKARLLSFAVVGGGITGVEIAGAIMDFLKAGCKYYDRIDPDELAVTILQGGSRILEQFPESLSSFGSREIQKQGVRVLTHARAQAVSGEGIQLQDGNFIRAGTVVSAVGNTVQPLFVDAGLPIERNRITVEPDMRVLGFDNVWALGDCAAVPNALDGSVSPTLAQFATRQAHQLANNMVAVLDGRPTQPFAYRMQGMFAALGRNHAIGLAFGCHFSGFFASLLWHSIYWMKMPTFSRKLQIGIDWVLDLFSAPDLVGLSPLTTQKGTHADDSLLQPLLDKHPELRQAPVASIFRRDPPHLERHQTLAEALEQMRNNGTTAFPILDETGKLVGICTRSDLYRALGDMRPPATCVHELMHSPVITVREDAVLDDVIRLARNHHIRQLAVVDTLEASRLVGMLAPIDVVHWFLNARLNPTRSPGPC